LYRTNDFVNDAYGIKLTPLQLQKYSRDYDEHHRSEQQRVAELETLKSNNGSLTLQVKRLEQSLAELNREHIELANAMVQGKMENAKLADENEALKEEVAQLKAVVEAQPAEVEGKLKEEMDRIMERNLEVMSMNRELEEQVASLERDLVETKLQFAQVMTVATVPLCSYVIGSSKSRDFDEEVERFAKGTRVVLGVVLRWRWMGEGISFLLLRDAFAYVWTGIYCAVISRGCGLAICYTEREINSLAERKETEFRGLD